MKKPATLWQVLERYPPIEVRLLAKRPGSGLRDLWLTDSDVAIHSGIPLTRIREISRMADWMDCTVAEVLAYTLACNFDPANPRDRQRVQQYQYLARKRGYQPCQYLKKSPRYESEILPLLLLIRERKLASTSRTLAAAR